MVKLVNQPIKDGGQGLPGFSGGCKIIGEDSVVAGVPGVSAGCVA